MKQLHLILCGALVATGLSIGALAQNAANRGGAAAAPKAPEPPKSVTIIGELIDSACYVASDGDAKGKDHAACAQKCMATGIPAAILPEGSKDAKAMMFLLTNPTVFAPFAAQTIKVEGTTHGDMHAFDVKKAYVKDGNNWKEIPLKDEHHNMTGGAASDGHTDHVHN